MKILISILTLIWLSSTMFILDERELAVVVMFGEPQETLEEPGLGFKYPWPIQDVHRFDKRSQLLEVEAQEAFTKDTKNVVLTPFAVWKIKEPILFLERVSTIDNAAIPLSDIVTSRIGASLGKVNFAEVLSVETSKEQLLPEGVLAEINEQTLRIGIEVQYVRLQMLNLPIQNEQSIYERMRAERSRVAERYRAEGKEQATQIKAQADSVATKIRTDAEKEAATTIALAEKNAALLYAESYQKSPELYRLIRDLESTEASLKQGGTLVLPANKRPFSTLLGENQ